MPQLFLLYKCIYRERERQRERERERKREKERVKNFSLKVYVLVDVW